MGCISSKMRLRSGSFRDELNQRFQISDKFHSLVHNGKDKLPSESNYCSVPAIEPVKLGTESEPTVCSAPGGEKSETLLVPESMKTEPTDYELRKQRSKSCHCFEELEFSGEQRFEGNNRYVLNSRNNSVTRAISFHTVEEFDALVERNLLSSIKQQFDDDPGKNGSLQSRQSTSSADDVSAINDSCPTEQKNLPSPEDTAALRTRQSISSEKENKVLEKGSKRKAIAKSLESLTIPQSIEFHPSLASVLKERLNVGRQISSPGEYVTPKFGSYTKKGLPLSQSSSFCKDEGDIFDSELMAAFEECMEQLEEEEEMVLKQIEESLIE